MTLNTISGVEEFLKQMAGIHEFSGIEGHLYCEGMDTCLRRYDEHLYEKLPDP